MANKYKRYEFRIYILDKKYIDSLIVDLARQGFAPYYNKGENAVYFEIDSTMMCGIGGGI